MVMFCIVAAVVVVGWALRCDARESSDRIHDHLEALGNLEVKVRREPPAWWGDYQKPPAESARKPRCGPARFTR